MIITSEVAIGFFVGFAGPFGEDGERIILGLAFGFFNFDAAGGDGITQTVTRFQAKLLPHVLGDDGLAFGRNFGICDVHTSKMSYFLTKIKLQCLMDSFTFTSPLWRYFGESAWHFVTLPLDVSARIKFLQQDRRGFGSVRVVASIGASRFETSVFPDSKSGSYLLPVKASVRKLEKIGHGDDVSVLVELR